MAPHPAQQTGGRDGEPPQQESARLSVRVEIVGTARVGHTLVAIAPCQTPLSPAPTVSIQWQRLWVDRSEGVGVKRAAAVGFQSRYFVQAADAGCRLRVVAACLLSDGSAGTIAFCEADVAAGDVEEPTSSSRGEAVGDAVATQRPRRSQTGSGGPVRSLSDPNLTALQLADVDEVVVSGRHSGEDNKISLDISGRLTLKRFKRRSGVMGHLENRSTRGEAMPQRKLIKPKSPDCRARLYSTLSRHYLFSSLGPEVIESSIDVMFEVHVAAGKAIIRQGERGDNFYVVDEGSFEAFIVTEDGKHPTVVATYAAGGSFGELALMYNASRAATVRALKPARLWAIDRTAFQDIVTTQAKGGEVRQFLREVSLFTYMSEFDLKTVADRLEERRYILGEKVIAAGETGRELYIVKEGTCAVLVNGKQVKELESRQFFGEGAILTGEPRTADVVASSSCTLLILNSDEFERLLPLGLGEIFDNQLKWDALRNLPMLNKLKLETVSSVGEQFEQVEFTRGSFLIRQGTEPDAFFIIKKGTVDVVRFEANGSATLVAKMGSRSGVGSRALLEDTVHPAGVLVSSDKVVAFRLPAPQFRQLLVDSARDERVGMLQTVPVLRPLVESQLAVIADNMRPARFAAGTMLVTQNEPGNKMFLVTSGTISVFHRAATSNVTVRVATLTAGGFFGEKALLRTEIRPNTYVADTDLHVLTLDGALFDPAEPLAGLRDLILEHTRIQESIKLAGAKLALGELVHHRTLGVGKFGRVRLVQHRISAATYALKMISKRLLIDSGQEEHVRNEVSAMKEVDHPFCAKLISTFSDRVWLYMMQELCLGGELFKIQELQPQQRFADGVARFYAACVASAVDHLHSRNIIYRDLKPENLLLDSQGYIKMVDFGFAKRVLGRTYTVCGTADYLAPEIITVKGHGREVDLWALGVLIYEMLVGRAPFAPIDSGICAQGTLVNGLQPGEDMSAMLSREKNILAGRYVLPHLLTKEAGQVIKNLLVKEQQARLGCGRGGFAQLKAHPWFSGLDWERLLMKKLPAPIVPRITHPLDASNFDEYDEEVDEQEHDGPEPLSDIF